METWPAHRDLYRDEMIRREGRGGYVASSCADCVMLGSSPAGLAQYRCLTCLPGPLLCAACLCKRHALLPTHRVQVSRIFPSTFTLRLTHHRSGTARHSSGLPSSMSALLSSWDMRTAHAAQTRFSPGKDSASSTRMDPTQSLYVSADAIARPSPAPRCSNFSDTTSIPPLTSSPTLRSRSG